MNLINLMMGMDEYNSKMLHTDTWLTDHRNLYKNPYTNWQNSPRFINIIVSTLEFYKRIYCYTYNIALDSNFRELKDLVLLLIFHPYDKVSVEAEITINKICACYQDREQIMNDMIDLSFPFFQAKLSRQSDGFIPKLI